MRTFKIEVTDTCGAIVRQFETDETGALNTARHARLLAARIDIREVLQS